MVSTVKTESGVAADSRTAMEPRKLKAIVALVTIAVNEYLVKVNTLLQAMQRQRKLLHLVAAIRQRKRAKPTTLPRVPVNCCPSVRTLLLDYLHDERLAFEQHFRVSRSTFRRMASLFARRGSHSWARDLELLIFLHWLAMGTSYRAIANTFGIPRSTIHGVVYRYVNNFVHHLDMLIQPPQTEGKLREVADGFSVLCSSESFGAAAGVVDTCCITTSNGETSALVQAVCDSRGHFLDFSVGYPANMEPSEVFRASPLYTKGNYPPPGYFLIAGEGYPCLSEPLTVIPPFRKPLQDEAEASFNAICNRALTVLHDSLSQMTGRWRLVFERRLATIRERTAKVVAICAMIHNLCVDEGDVWVEPEGEGQGQSLLSVDPVGDFSWCVPGDEEADDEGGLNARLNLAQALLAGDNAPCRVQLEHDYCEPEDEDSTGDCDMEGEDCIELQPIQITDIVTMGAQEEEEEGVMDHDYLVAAECTV